FSKKPIKHTIFYKTVFKNVLSPSVRIPYFSLFFCRKFSQKSSKKAIFAKKILSNSLFEQP
ncbi:hypothetical protein KAR52_03565, partial [Candidatus Pacearchaeota archaeon]|nr:hypothetical protein [Candidatus Pacearchaeota archaeon]